MDILNECFQDLQVEAKDESPTNNDTIAILELSQQLQSLTVTQYSQKYFMLVDSTDSHRHQSIKFKSTQWVMQNLNGMAVTIPLCLTVNHLLSYLITQLPPKLSELHKQLSNAVLRIWMPISMNSRAYCIVNDQNLPILFVKPTNNIICLSLERKNVKPEIQLIHKVRCGRPKNKHQKLDCVLSHKEWYHNNLKPLGYAFIHIYTPIWFVQQRQRAKSKQWCPPEVIFCPTCVARQPQLSVMKHHNVHSIGTEPFKYSRIWDHCQSKHRKLAEHTKFCFSVFFHTPWMYIIHVLC